VVSFGRTKREPIPEYGYDACDETVEDCARLLRDVVSAVTAGSFGERIVYNHDGIWHETWRSTKIGSRSSRSRVTAEQARALREEPGSDDARWAH
jgi:hypothetical protein